MSLLISAAELEARARQLAGAPELAALAARLDATLAPFLERPLYVPRAKALYSRWGGACRDDGAELDFDPWSPEAQRCTRCGRIWATEQTHRWWVYFYQLWLAERVWMAALRSVSGGEARAGPKGVEALGALLERYPEYPPYDNVLGPSRPFFSTYLESIWVLQLAAAASLLEESGAMPLDLVRDLRAHLFRPAALLIADFPEARSNRQAWNAAALYALGAVLGDEAMRREAAHGEAGILATLQAGLAPDGLWYEGENYHWFALRGLAWGVEMLRAAGEADLWRDQGSAGCRFRAAFRAPALTALPDFTAPARRDSRFGVSLRQRRMAELLELALARTGDELHASLLRFVYEPSIEAARATGAEITEVERAEPAGGLRRETLGWKGLLWMTPSLPAADPEAWRPGTVHLEGTGLAVFRDLELARYVSLDYGESGGGHGHPDRLNLTLHQGGVPWLLDFGTASYAAPSLAWYRSTLAHNAPLLDGLSQGEGRGVCVGFADCGDAGWICAQLMDGAAYEGAALQRTVVVTKGYVLDVVQMGSHSGERTLAVPWHGLGRALADERGVRFERAEGSLRLLLGGRQPYQVQMSRGPGPPDGSGGGPELAFPVVMATGEAVTLLACLDTTGTVEEVDCGEEEFYVRLVGGGLHTHRATESGWLIDMGRGDPIELGGLRELPEPPAPAPETRPVTAARCPRLMAAPALDGSMSGFRLDEPLTLAEERQFRRAEERWEGPDRFSARAYLGHDGEHVYLGVDVVAPDPCFRPAEAGDPELENEDPDIHSDGLQVYVSTSGFYGWVVVPEERGTRRLRVSAVRGSDAAPEMVSGAWAPSERGYRVTLALLLPEALDGFGFELCVNRARPDRQRRVGQLVWSGSRGTRLYLAGDRPLAGPLPWIEVER